MKHLLISHKSAVFLTVNCRNRSVVYTKASAAVVKIMKLGEFQMNRLILTPCCLCLTGYRDGKEKLSYRRGGRVVGICVLICRKKRSKTVFSQ